jgi:hypothetical protein
MNVRWKGYTWTTRGNFLASEGELVGKFPCAGYLGHPFEKIG